MSVVKITVLVDPEAGEQFMGLLGKALGRREMGLIDIRMEPEPNVAPRAVTVARHTERVVLAAPSRVTRKVAALAASKRRTGRSRSKGQVDTEHGMAKILLDMMRRENKPVPRGFFTRELELNNFKGSSANGVIDRLKKVNLIRHNGDDGYVLVSAAG